MLRQRWLVIVAVAVVGLGFGLYLLLRPAPQEVVDLEKVRQQMGAGQYVDARVALERAVSENPDDAEAYFLLALVQFNLQEYDDAKAHFEHVLELDPERGSAVHHNLGVLAYQQGDLDEAVGQFQRALATDPKDPDSHYQLGATYLVMALPMGALEPDAALLGLAGTEFDLALEYSPGKPEALVGIANIYLLRNDVSQAIVVLEQVVDENPDMSEALFALGRSYAAVGDTEQALAILKRFLETSPPEMWANQAQELIQQLEQ